ncbi:protein kinase [Streptomyces finlayi]|uniref:Protein kinase n=1 Tax=Streptomyces finlayi TaxID=67296 RepID=A0A7G7BGB2_9ACTN|nr:protein kinase [Streptomyces finlayi]
MKQLTADDPAHIGPYRLIARLGEGGMGLVYLGRSEAGRTVAVKVVQAEYAGNSEFRRRFAREVAAARRVGGSWTAAVLDADPEAAIPWVATQYIPGPDLSTVVAEDYGPLPEHSVHTLANRLALALRGVHEAGLIHRDLKPSNVLVTVDGPRVIDFGIARAMDSLAGDSLHTRTGMLIGSPGFMSPEQVRGLELTPASDVFCLGAVLVHASTGRLLFGAADTGLPAHLFRIAEDEADLTGVPETLVELVRDCLEKDPAKRPTPQQVAERTAKAPAGEWLPGAVLAQLGRHAAALLDYAPELPVQTPVVQPDPDPRIPAVRPQPLPAPPAYVPTAPAHAGFAPGFGPPPGPLPGAWPAQPAPPGFQDAAPPHSRRWWGLVVIALAQLLVLLDAEAFIMAVPSVQADLAMSRDDVTLMFTAYALGFGGLLLLRRIPRGPRGAQTHSDHRPRRIRARLRARRLGRRFAHPGGGASAAGCRRRAGDAVRSRPGGQRFHRCEGTAHGIRRLRRDRGRRLGAGTGRRWMAPRDPDVAVVPVHRRRPRRDHPRRRADAAARRPPPHRRPPRHGRDAARYRRTPRPHLRPVRRGAARLDGPAGRGAARAGHHPARGLPGVADHADGVHPRGDRRLVRGQRP